jgi:hypothetical protein
MNHEPDTYKPGLLRETQDEIDRDGPERVQWMKIDATPRRIIDWIGQEMVEIQRSPSCR